MTNPVALYVAVYEYQGTPPSGFTKSAKRHCGIVLEPRPNANLFICHEIIEDRSTKALTYRCTSKPDPTWTDRTLLAMDFVAWIPAAQAVRLSSMFETPGGQSTKGWNSQFFIREALKRMTEARLVTLTEYRIAISKQQEAINAAELSEQPNFLPDILDPRDELKGIDNPGPENREGGAGAA